MVENQHPNLESETQAQENQKLRPRGTHLELLVSPCAKERIETIFQFERSEVENLGGVHE